MSDARKLLALRVRQARTDADFTQSQLGSMTGHTKQWVSEVERGSISPSFEAIVLIAKCCGKSTDFFTT